MKLVAAVVIAVASLAASFAPSASARGVSVAYHRDHHSSGYYRGGSGWYGYGGFGWGGGWYRPYYAPAYYAPAYYAPAYYAPAYYYPTYAYPAYPYYGYGYGGGCGCSYPSVSYGVTVGGYWR